MSALTGTELTELRTAAHRKRLALLALLASVTSGERTIADVAELARNDDNFKKISISEILRRSGSSLSRVEQVLEQLQAVAKSRTPPVKVGWLVHSQSTDRVGLLVALLADHRTQVRPGFPWAGPE
jgi:hypothetical protein